MVSQLRVVNWAAALGMGLMDSKITDQQPELQLSEPHFDEEATLLSARPVVPLHDVGVKRRFQRQLFYALTIGVAVLAGAFASTLIYKRGQEPETAIVETEAPISEQASPEDQLISGAGGAVFSSGGPVSSPAANEDDVPGREPHNADAATQRKIPAAPFSQSHRPERATGSEAIQQGDVREMRRAERIAARRLVRKAEREAKREARGHSGQSARDLLRIREIFEGAPRP
jgi:hypothetical protein